MELMDTDMYINDEDLFDYACSAARLAQPKGRCGGRSIAVGLRRSYAEIKHCHSIIERRYGALPTPPAACEWLLDNWYMVQREYMSSCGELRAASRLRLCEDGALIYELCRALVSSGGGSVTEKRCLIFLDGYQSVTVLSRSELHAFPVALRAALISAVAAVCAGLQVSAEMSAQAKELEALFGSLRLISVVDMEKLINSADLTGAILAADPSGDYSKMDNGSKQEYLRRIEKLAAMEDVEEHQYAKKLVKRAKAEGRHVGFYLFDTRKKRGVGVYIAANVIATLFFSLLLAFRFESAAAAMLMLIPVSELVKSLTDYLLLRIVPPVRLARIDTQHGVPDEGRSICVVSTLLDGTDPTRRLEELYYACRAEGKNVQFGLLGDLPVADTEETADDARVLNVAADAVSRLNRRYGGGFFLFTRHRSFDGCRWYGSERKRGALVELARLLCGERSELELCGERASLYGTRYIVTLDSDTKIYPGSIGELIGAMLHPLNAPVVDELHRTVSAGHAVIHPRIDTDLSTANATDFALIFAGAGGCDPYGSLCGELYMNAFGSGGFAGKGIISAEALLKCTADRFPEGRILSHDALEGAFLRGAYMGDVEFSDRFPSKPLSYYRRLHRWVRGDWQNAPWIFSRDLSDIDRWRLLDTLRRSLVSPMTLTAIVLGFFMPVRGLSVAAWAALLALVSRIFLALAESGLGRREKVRLRRYTRLLTGAGGAIVQTFIRLWLLPFDAWVCLTAAVTALWRMLVSHRELLQWQTAAQSEADGSASFAHLRAMWFPVVLGLTLLWLSPSVIGRSAGLLWLLSPFAASALALPVRAEMSLSESDRKYLTRAVAESWLYLRRFSTSENNYLPPDNFQEQPPVGVAHRTSPTNIGLAMAAAAGACEMGVISRGEAVEYIGRIISTMERMERGGGQFFNWYDTRTLRPLSPAYISTVDSGNLYAGLQAAGSALRDWGEELLAARTERLAADMDFTPLYDAGRGLFYICYDHAVGRGVGGWYDLLASEAMLTSYIAVAKGDVPVKHWRRLSRAQLQEDGYRGLASWTGTMFEYLMPELFLPLYHGSLLYESCKFCMHAQKRRVFSGKPWGVSESAFFSLDSALSYRYKAHGCAALALKRGQDADMVVSPYSSFLALAVEPENAVRNLRRLESFGAMGRFGFIEALDFTPGRCRSSDGEQVRCYMAHHVSMSIIAAANAVADGVVRRCFLADGAMSACLLLLQEKLPSSGVVIRRSMAEVPEKRERSLSDRWRVRGSEEDVGERCCVLSNGAYSMTVSNSGVTGASCGGIVIYSAQRGVALTVSTQNSRVRLPCDAPRTWELAEDVCRFRISEGGLDCTVSINAANGDCGELRIVEVDGSGPAHLSLSFVPVLADAADYNSHQAYWSLGMFAEQEGNSLLIRRLRRGDKREQWLCLTSDRAMSYTADTSGKPGYLTRPLVTAVTELTLEEGSVSSLRFALCVAGSRSEAVSGAGRILVSCGDCGAMVGAAALHLGLGSAELGKAMELLPPLLKNALRDAAPKRELWQYGISGDLPLICCDGSALESGAVLRYFCLLKSCGVNAELVYLTDEQGEYQRPVYRRVSAELAKVGLEALLGVRGGVHFAPLNAQRSIASRSAVCIGREGAARRALPLPWLSAPRQIGAVPKYDWTGGTFSFTVRDNLPSRIWQHMLTNGSLSYIATDCGVGSMFFKNAHEMPIVAPPPDISATLGAEALWLETGGKCASLFAANDGCECCVSFTPGLAVWQKSLPGMNVRTTAFVPMDSDARLFIIEGAAGARLCWRMETVFGSRDGAAVRCLADNGVFSCENPDAFLPDTEFHACASVPAHIDADFDRPGMFMTVTAGELTVLACGCCGIDVLRSLCHADAASEAEDNVKAYWNGLLGRIKISTGVTVLDRYMNGWCAYQCIACRLMGRSSLYQSGGAIGFRDQLQDTVNMLLLSAGFARSRIIDCCRHQYPEGDVMHWWHVHPDGDRGVRTRCSDDYLWLVWALCEYVQATGDTGICAAEARYLSSPVLSEAEHDRYETPALSESSSTVLEHARAALELAVSRGLGPHGLPMFGSGDWNDALDSVQGESVWLGWFMAHCFTRFAALLDSLGESGGKRYLDHGAAIAAAADASWNGQWYPRGIEAQGAPLGGVSRIDSVSQSWSVLCGCVGGERPKMAVRSALSALTDRKRRLVKLFEPPCSPDAPYMGYISGYGEGIRENGGQYTHGAIWLALAALKSGLKNEAWELLLLLLPEGRDMARYGAEPFVLPADVYSAAGHEGEAGWTWYTGSAGWYFRAVITELLGLRLVGGEPVFNPDTPPVLSDFSVEYSSANGERRTLRVAGGKIATDGKET